MPFNSALRAGVMTAALVMLFASSMNAAEAGDNSAKLPRHHRARDVAYRSHGIAEGGTLPYAPNYGFLSHVPSDAIRMPGYTFVPGVGILGESCDLPTSACSNRYRDVQ